MTEDGNVNPGGGGSLVKRFLVPIAAGLAVMFVSRSMFFNSVLIDNQSLYHATAIAFGAAYFLCIAFISPLIYLFAYSRGASLPERAVAGATRRRSLCCAR